MTRATAPQASETVVVEERKKRAAWKPLAAAGIGGAVLVATGFGVFAQLNATATSLTPQTIDSGTLRLALNKNAEGNSTASFSTEVNKVAPGDVVNRLVTLSSTGTLEGRLPTLQLTETTPATAGPLTNDASRGLQVTVSRCSTAWTVAAAGATPACPTGSTVAPVLASTPATALQAGQVALGNLVLTPGADNFLLVSIALPDLPNNETAVNGVLPTPAGGTIQGRTSNLTWTFRDTQRAGTTFNGTAGTNL